MDIAGVRRASGLTVLPPSLDALSPIVIDDLVRMGIPRDGGYVVSRSAVLAADALVSFGLGPDWSFEQDVASSNPGIHIHVYDHTVGDRSFMEKVAAAWRQRGLDQATAAELDLLVSRYAAYRSFFSGNAIHFPQRVFDRMVYPNDVTPVTILERLQSLRKLIVKIDIEGGEYRVLDELIERHARILLLIVEFHSTDFLRKLFLAKIATIRQHYRIVHVHGNNYAGLGRDGLPELLEITFLHKSLCIEGQRRSRLPVAGLDFPNDPAVADFEIAFSRDAP